MDFPGANRAAGGQCRALLMGSSKTLSLLLFGLNDALCLQFQAFPCQSVSLWWDLMRIFLLHNMCLYLGYFYSQIQAGDEGFSTHGRLLRRIVLHSFFEPGLGFPLRKQKPRWASGITQVIP